MVHIVNIVQMCRHRASYSGLSTTITVCALIFAGVYFAYLKFHVFRVFKFTAAGYSGVEIFAGEIFADIR